MIALRNIERSFDYGKEKNPVLRGINLDIEEGDFITIGAIGFGQIHAAARFGHARHGVDGRILFLRSGRA